MGRRSAAFIIVVFALIVGGLLVTTGTVPWMRASQETLAQSTPPAPAMQAAPSLAGIETALEGVYSRVSPSVVAIRVVQRQAAGASGMPGFPFFGPPSSGQPRAPEQYRQGLGSGFVWDREGHIVTNNHVVADAERIEVMFDDGTVMPARVVGRDPHSDLAVVQVTGASGKLRPVTLADSTRVRVGQLAIAIGNPFGERNTMTIGIISGLGRSLPASDGTPAGATYTIPDVIQTDAPINPGNSGGVLLDAGGRVIGVTAAIESPAGVSAGIGFAIPSAIVQRVVPSLIETGGYRHPWLGVSGVSLSPDLARAAGFTPEQRGALVVDVVPAGPADRAHLRGSAREVSVEGVPARVGGDVIVAIDDHPVKTFDDVVAYLARSTAVGQKVTLTVLRDGRTERVVVTLGARPAAAGR
ncbi:MAG: trypsin-like peptidase domain-containing protein [Armatimonadota bacterium]|nr:trypsin-like peptidase domain-containing protein [Armatimonadota bacterium]